MAEEAPGSAPDPTTGAPEKTGTEKIDAGKEPEKTEAPKGDGADPVALQAQKEHFRKKAEDAEKKLAERDAADEAAKLEEAKKKQEFETLYEDEKQKREAAETRANTIAISGALAVKLAAEGCVAPNDAAVLIDKTAITVGEDGTVTGVDEAIAALKESSQYLFTEKPTPVNSNGVTPKADAGDPAEDTRTWKASELKGMSHEDYMKNRESIQKAKREKRFLIDQ